MDKKYLLIPYEKKDELKKQFKIRWDPNVKLWYVVEMVDGLKPYIIYKIEVDYDDKDILKSKYKSMRWHTQDKTWICSCDDYLNFIGKKKS